MQPLPPILPAAPSQQTSGRRAPSATPPAALSYWQATTPVSTAAPWTVALQQVTPSPAAASARTASTGIPCCLSARLNAMEQRFGRRGQTPAISAIPSNPSPTKHPASLAPLPTLTDTPKTAPPAPAMPDTYGKHRRRALLVARSWPPARSAIVLRVSLLEDGALLAKLIVTPKEL